MTRRVSLASQIAAVRYEIGRSARKGEFWSPAQRNLHREHLADALASLCWLQANRDWVYQSALRRDVEGHVGAPTAAR